MIKKRIKQSEKNIETINKKHLQKFEKINEKIKLIDSTSFMK